VSSQGANGFSDAFNNGIRGVTFAGVVTTLAGLIFDWPALIVLFLFILLVLFKKEVGGYPRA
jgi:hypothetical protein